MRECIFCEIVKGKREKNHKILENDKHLAFLDIYPVTKGQTLVIPKKHYKGLGVFSLTRNEYEDLFLFAKKTARKIKKKLKPKFIIMVVEGMMIDHLHIKLYPIYKIQKKSDNRLLKPYQPYKGYLITQIGPKASEKKLKRIARLLS
ncbi:MAG: HIT domain-containing protein [Candidatus Aenigmatarchaeota archaeon]